MLDLNKAWMLSLAVAFFLAVSASLSDAYTIAPNAVAAAQTVASCTPDTGQPGRKALGGSPFLEPEDGSLAHVESAKPLKLYILVERLANDDAPGIEIHSPKLDPPVVSSFALVLTTVLVL